MAQTINTNLSSLTAQRNSQRTQGELATSIARLSSGLRINSAKDDAAGLAISERFTSQIRGTNQAARNANDGISLAQVAEGGLASVGDNLQRIRELSVQSANATNSTSDRIALQQEVAQLKAEIDRVGQQTQFNGLNLLDGTFASQQFQVGANAGQTIQVSGIASARASALGASYAASQTSTIGLSGTAVVTGALTLNSIPVTAPVAGAQAGQAANSAYAIALAINNSQSNVLATPSPTVRSTGSAPTAFGAVAPGAIIINGVNVPAFSGGIDGPTQGTAVAAAINGISAATGVTATADTLGVVTLTAPDGRNILVGGTVPTTTGLSAGTSYAQLTLSTSSTQQATSNIVIGGSAPASTGFSASTVAGTITGTAVSNIDISTVAGANASLASVDAALTTVNSERAKLGAIQNRFTSTIDNLQVSSENLTASRSRIQDADFAAETAALARAQVLQQAGTAMIAQANQLPNQVLQLLR